MNRYVAGIDGGQSSTTAVIGDETGRILGRGCSGGADEVGVDAASTRLRDALEAALAGAIAAAGLAANARFDAVVAGVSGYEGRLLGESPVFPTPRFVLMHDAPVAHAGALAGEPGVTIVAGSGSVVYATGRAGGRTTGGWGYLFGDEGSAFWLARRAVAELMRREDDGDPTLVQEGRLACDFFAQPSLRRLARAVYSGEIGRDRLATWAPHVLELSCFDPVVAEGTDRLAALAAQAIDAGAYPRFTCVGGLFRNAAYRRRLQDAVLRREPGAQAVEPRFEPAVGALFLAYREAGIPVEPQLP